MNFSVFVVIIVWYQHRVCICEPQRRLSFDQDSLETGRSSKEWEYMDNDSPYMDRHENNRANSWDSQNMHDHMHDVPFNPEKSLEWPNMDDLDVHNNKREQNTNRPSRGFTKIIERVPRPNQPVVHFVNKLIQQRNTRPKYKQKINNVKLIKKVPGINPRSSIQQISRKPIQQKKRNPTKLIRNPTKLVRNPTKIVRNPTKLVRNPTKIVRNPTKLIRNPTSLVKNPTKLIRNPTSLVKNPTKLVRNPTKTKQSKTLSTTERVTVPPAERKALVAKLLKMIRGDPMTSKKPNPKAVWFSTMLIKSMKKKPKTKPFKSQFGNEAFFDGEHNKAEIGNQAEKPSHK